MSERNLLEGLSPVTQPVDAGKALAKFLGMNEELTEIIALANGARLVLSTKHDCYYYTSEKSCTCKAGTYGRICRHRKALESPKPRGQSLAQTLEEHDRNLSKMPKSYPRMVRMAREESEAEPLELIHKTGFRPCLEEEDEPKASPPIAEMLIDAVFPTTLPGEIEYWNQKAKMEA